MMRNVLCALAFAASLGPLPAHAGWQADTRVEYYAVSGRTGIELYRSIGENGPKIGIGRVIAYTDFELTWARDYRPASDGSCTLASAKPKLTIVYKLPRPKDDLPAATRRLWSEFIAGIRVHEQVHGEMIIDMVKALEAFSVGLKVDNDPKCRKIRQVMVDPFRAISNARLQKSQAFDHEEMRDGGNMHRLVLRLVNGE